jgi:hypothetical protein
MDAPRHTFTLSQLMTSRPHSSTTLGTLYKASFPAMSFICQPTHRPISSNALYLLVQQAAVDSL